MDRRIMVEVTKEELERLDKEETIESTIDNLINKLDNQKPTKVLLKNDSIVEGTSAVKIYEFEKYTIRISVSPYTYPQINIIYK